METVRCQEKRMKFRKFVFWNIFRLEATADEIDVNTIPSFGENESHVPRRRAELLTFSKRKKVVGTAHVDCAPRTFTPWARLHSPGTEIDFSGAPARAKRARSGAPSVRKFGKLSIRENLVLT